MMLLSLSGCGDGRELREWQPSDHSQPEGATEAPDTGATQEQAVQALFMARCAPCHGESGHGDGPSAPPVARMPDLSSVSFQDARSDSDLRASILFGRGMMPAFGDVIGEQGAAALVGYVRTLRRP